MKKLLKYIIPILIFFALTISANAEWWSKNASQSLVTNDGSGPANADIHVRNCYLGLGTTPCGSAGGGSVTNFIFNDGSGFDGTVTTSTTTPTLALTTTLASGRLPFITTGGALTSNSLLTINNSGSIPELKIGSAGTANRIIEVNNALTGQTANKFGVFSRDTGTYDTTGGTLTSYAGYFENTSTRSAGANIKTNIGLYANASGAQVNYSAIFGSGYVGVAVGAPTALLHIGAGASSASGAPLKINLGGSLLATPEAGAIEVTNTHIYWTNAGLTRYQLDQQTFTLTDGSGTTASGTSINWTGPLSNDVNVPMGGQIINLGADRVTSLFMDGNDSITLGDVANVDSGNRLVISNGGNNSLTNLAFNTRFGINTATPTSNLHIAGSIALPNTKVSSNEYNILDSDYTLSVNNGSDGYDIFLPTASNSPGRIYIIKRFSESSSGSISIKSNGGDVQDPADGIFRSTVGLGNWGSLTQSIMYQSNGTDWEAIK